ncbi:GNAT family N-acetyltransferase [Arthrobacter globiformis]|uniref:GNAT family N-acetyltransferase n=1 Tax=Arthrobacter globiformis TaxID=1665 RepID=UPI0027D8D6C6|nr:GNAT family N-acetyltransferase [Arthrobacter globiformis]
MTRLRRLSGIIAIEEKAGRTAAKPSTITDTVIDPDRQIVVAVAEGTIVGWAKTHLWDYSDDQAIAGHYLGGVTVLPRWRRRGIAAVLTEARLAWIAERASDAWYVVNAGNTASIELHRRWDFSEVARGPRIHTTTFEGGIGVLMHARFAE